MPFLKASLPHKEVVSPGGDISAVTQEKKEEITTEEERGREATAVGGACAPTSGAALPSSSSNGLGHHGEPAQPEEGEVGEPHEEEIEVEEEHGDGTPARLLRAPRTPSQSEGNCMRRYTYLMLNGVNTASEDEDATNLIRAERRRKQQGLAKMSSSTRGRVRLAKERRRSREHRRLALTISSSEPTA